MLVREAFTHFVVNLSNPYTSKRKVNRARIRTASTSEPCLHAFNRIFLPATPYSLHVFVVHGAGMPKRRFEADDALTHLPKRRRVGPLIRLDNISDELVLRVLCYLSPAELGRVACVSQRFLRLCNDNESWKERYYARWVQPRLLQIRSTIPHSKRDVPRYSSRSANWLDYRHLVFPFKITDWKWQYRVRKNWHKGTCNVEALEVAQPPAAPVIIKTHDGLVFEADPTCLRVWSSRKASTCVASELFEQRSEYKVSPTAMIIDASSETLRLGIGFSNSSFSCYEYSDSIGLVQYGATQHYLDHSEPVSVLAMHFPYVFALIGSRNFLLEQLPSTENAETKIWEELAWLQAGRRHECPPALALRKIGKEVTASIAYASELVGGRDWSLGIQEVRISNGTEVPHWQNPISCPNPEIAPNELSRAFYLEMRTFDAWTPAFPMHPDVDSRPKFLSYSHPYLLAALPDNTMMIYLVTSTSENLSISDGSRLWGHTSCVSGVAMNARGKAVTTSTKGGEIRVWDLESIAQGISHGRVSIPLIPSQSPAYTHSSVTPKMFAHSRVDYDQLAFLQSWIAFDDEQVLVLGEDRNKRTLARYDFTR